MLNMLRNPLQTFFSLFFFTLSFTRTTFLIRIRKCSLHHKRAVYNNLILSATFQSCLLGVIWLLISCLIARMIWNFTDGMHVLGVLDDTTAQRNGLPLSPLPSCSHPHELEQTFSHHSANWEWNCFRLKSTIWFTLAVCVYLPQRRNARK